MPTSVRRVLETYWIGNDQSLIYVTNWTLVHFLSGVLLVWAVPTVSGRTAFWVHSAWEAWQILVGNTPWRTTRGQLDVLVDTLFFMAGVYTR